MEQERSKKMNKDTIRKDAKFVHIHTGQIIVCLSEGPFVTALPLGHDVTTIIVPENYKYYERFTPLGGR